MINQDKLILQTKAAIFEQKEERKALNVIRYTRADYVSFHALLACVAMTAGFGVVLGLYLMYQIDELAVTVNLREMIPVAEQVLLIYLIALVVYLVLAIVIFSVRYSSAQRKCKQYKALLKRLNIVTVKAEREKRRAEQENMSGRS